MELINVCRTCFRSDVALCNLVVSITPKNELTSSGVLELWNIYNRILITNDSTLPDLICTDCTENIQQTYKFVMKCEQSESEFRLLNQNKIVNQNLDDEYIDISQIQKNDLFSNERSSLTERKDCNQTKQANSCDNESGIENQRKNESNSENCRVQVKQEAKDHENVIFEVINLTDNEEFTLGVTCDGAKKNIKQEPVHSLGDDPQFAILEAIKGEKCEKSGVQCPACAYKCGAVEILEKHIAHTHIAGSMCRICDQEFKCSPLKHSSKHIPRIHQSLDKGSHSYEELIKNFHLNYPFRCQQCMKPFRSKTGYNYHMFSKHGHMDENEKVMECMVCSKYFKSNSALESHMRTHSGEKPYPCKFCGKTFVQKGHLIVHIRRHTGERPYKCEFCPKAFPDKSNFNKHMLFHTGEKPYKCEICGQAFQRKCSMNLHYLCHTGEQPYECVVCLKKFKQRLSWKRHMKWHGLSSVDSKKRLNQSLVSVGRKCLNGIVANEA